jgi:threonylcarbamoyladenosine tRNA methylthiotransferase MtaB
MRYAALHNLGCKVNACETEAMREILEQDGYQIVDFSEKADVYVINTCTVTQIADRKSRQMLHRARRLNPDAIVIATGCYVESAKLTGEEDDAVDIYIGNNEKGRLLELIQRFQKEQATIHSTSDINKEKEYESLPIHVSGDHTRAFLKIQDGCNRFCSYCIIPYVRGRIRSSSPQEVLRQIEELAASGTKEVVLDGIHLTSYGLDLSTDLISLLKEIDQIDGLERIRLGSIEPTFITEESAAELASLKKLCPHFHLSLQSGCDSVLKRMNRHYTTAEFEKICEILRRHFDQPALTTDIITGFPGETEEEFEETYRFMEKLSFYEIHVFPYSVRKGTKAASMPEQNTKKTKSERSARLLALTEKQKKAYEQAHIGKKLSVLIEEKGLGHSKEYLYVHAKGQAGEIVSGILRNQGDYLYLSE